VRRAARVSLLRRIGRDLPLAWRVCAAFFVYAFAMGGIFPRLPEIQRGLGAGEGAFGFALIGAACGTLLSLSFAGPALDRIGHRRALLGLVAALPVCYAVAASAASPVAFFLLLVPAGLCIGAIEIIVNLEADRVEHQTGQRFMNRAHAFWSIGFFVSGGFGALLSQLGVSPQGQLWLVVPIVLAASALLLGRFDAAPHRDTAHRGAPARFARPTLGVMGLVALTLSAMVLEGAGADWSAIYMRDVFGAAPATPGAAPRSRSVRWRRRSPGSTPTASSSGTRRSSSRACCWARSAPARCSCSRRRPAGSPWSASR
jgi:MFS family permease